MSRWVELYPAAWRERYGDELDWLLSERPPGPLDHVDLARGALDAHLDPQLPGDARRRVPWTHRLPGVLAIMGGAGWIASATLAWTSPDGADALIPVSVVAMMLSVSGVFLRRWRMAFGRGLVVASGLFAAAVIAPWPASVLAFAVLVALVGAGLLALGAIRAGMEPVRRWALVAVGIGMPLVAVLPILAGGIVLQETASWPLVGAIATYGVAWLVVGGMMSRRGVATFERRDGIEEVADD